MIPASVPSSQPPLTVPPVARGKSAASVGHLAKAAVAAAQEAGVDLPKNAQGLAASQIAKGADPASLFAAVVSDEDPTVNPVAPEDETAVPDDVAPGDEVTASDSPELGDALPIVPSALPIRETLDVVAKWQAALEMLSRNTQPDPA